MRARFEVVSLPVNDYIVKRSPTAAFPDLARQQKERDTPPSVRFGPLSLFTQHIVHFNRDLGLRRAVAVAPSWPFRSVLRHCSRQQRQLALYIGLAGSA